MVGIVLMTFDMSQEKVVCISEEMVGVFRNEIESKYIVDELNKLMLSEQSQYKLAHKYQLFHFEPQNEFEYENTKYLKQLGDEFLKQMKLKRIIFENESNQNLDDTEVIHLS
mgnify:CR=1 FL=1